MSEKRWKLMHCRFEFKAADCWVGLFWRWKILRLDLWLCLFPCLPLHVTLVRLPRREHDR
jgi:hypothetical protein